MMRDDGWGDDGGDECYHQRQLSILTSPHDTLPHCSMRTSQDGLFQATLQYLCCSNLPTVLIVLLFLAMPSVR